MKGFADVGFRTQSQPLSHFQTDYGLAGDDHEAEEESEDDEEADGESADDESDEE